MEVSLTSGLVLKKSCKTHLPEMIFSGLADLVSCHQSPQVGLIQMFLNLPL